MNFEKVPSIWFLLSLMVYAVGIVIALALAPWSFTGGFAAGGALVLLNAWASARRMKTAPLPDRGMVMASVMGGFYVRLILLGICLYVLVTIARVDPVGLIAGLSVVPAGLLVMLGFIYIANRRPREV
jgi:hypothetical protein